MERIGNNLEFHFKNIGYVKEGSLELGDLTIIGGLNNTGKTYINYCIYGFFHSFQRMSMALSLQPISEEQAKELYKKRTISIDILGNFKSIYEKSFWKNISDNYSSMLPNLFNISRDYLEDSRCNILMKNGYSDEELKQHILGMTIERNITLLDEHKLFIQKERGETQINLRFEENMLNKITYYGIMHGVINFVLYDVLFSDLPFSKNPFAITSERTGISLFHTELATKRSLLVDELTSQKGVEAFDRSKFVKQTARYALPGNDNIYYVRDFEHHSKQLGELWKIKDSTDGIKTLRNELIKGEFRVIDGVYYYHPENMDHPIPLYHSSSSIKSLFALDIYLKHFAAPGDILFIDEPELNLHPKYQIMMARLLARLVNSGISVLITTHSDFIINELSNLVMLSEAEENDRKYLLEKYNYDEDELLKSERVKCYRMSDNTIKKCSVDNNGILMDEIDETIGSLNQRYLDIHSHS